MMRDLLTEVLTHDGHEVLGARDSAEMLEQLGSQLLRPVRESPFDLIVSDLGGSGLTALSVLAGLRDADWETPFILMTAFGGPCVLDEALRHGATVLDEPFDVNGFRVAVLDHTFPCALPAAARPRCSACGGIHHVHAHARTPDEFSCLECAGAELHAVDLDGCSACGHWHQVREQEGAPSRRECLECLECLGAKGEVARLYLDLGGGGG